jgi:glycosyltransferase involved in cell wall biosynthesis
MKVLFLAPQPFYQERGTPIAVRLAAEALGARYCSNQDRLDLLVYHEGEDIQMPGVSIHRISGCEKIRNISPGISLKKIICDFYFLIAAIKLAWRHRKNQYDLVHAVEESVFIAMLLRLFFRIPYIYDMDSSIALQATEKWQALRPLYPVLAWFEKLGVTFSRAVVPVCDALAVLADKHGSKHTHILRDVSLMSSNVSSEINLRREISADTEDVIILYVGNLEPYQGVDLLMEGFLAIAEGAPKARLAIIGGSESHRNLLSEKVSDSRFASRAHIMGPRPVGLLGDYLSQADILASPRSKGNNTPMKIYSYLHAGKAILATELPTHTQVLNHDVALLVAPRASDIGEGIKHLIENPLFRKKLGKNAFHYAEENFTIRVFTKRLNELYSKIEEQLAIKLRNDQSDQAPPRCQ